MKTVFIVYSIYVMVCNAYNFPEVTIKQYYVPIINIKGTNETIVIVKENSTDDFLIDSVILALSSDQSVILSRDDEFIKKVTKAKHNKFPNLIILTENLSVHELKSASFKSILKSYWSPVYLIITTRSGNKTCENGTVSKDFFENARVYLNTMWHRYQVVRVIIAFPYTCPNHYIIYSGKKPSHRKLYDRNIKMITARDKTELEMQIQIASKLQDLTDGYPLRANIFARFPTSVTQCDVTKYYKKMNLNYSNGFCGLDGMLMHDFISHYRYNLSSPSDETCNKYGFLDPITKIVSGSLGCIVRGQLDISFNSRFLVQYTTDRYFYLHYIITDDLAVLLKRPGIIPLWHYAYNNYSPRLMTIFTTLLLALSVLTWAMTRMTKGITGVEPGKLYEYVLNAFSSTIFGFPVVKRSQAFLLLKGASLLASIILSAIYQGNVNYQFTTRTRYKEIRTLRQLYNSHYTLFISPSILDLVICAANPRDKMQMEFLHRAQIKDENDEVSSLGHIIDHPKEATLGRCEDVKIEILLNFTDKADAPQIYVVDESFHSYYLSYIARPGFLFVEESLRFMMRMLEAGLPNKYYVWSRRIFTLRDTYSQTRSEPRPFGQMKLQHQRVAYFVLSFGYLASTCCFLLEKYRGRSNKKHVTQTRSHSSQSSEEL